MKRNRRKPVKFAYKSKSHREPFPVFKPPPPRTVKDVVSSWKEKGKQRPKT